MARIITIGSYRSGVGKSMIAANLAAQLAATGQRVGLAELNFTAPQSQAILFGITEPVHTLAECVRGECQPGAVGTNVFLDRKELGDLWVFPWMEQHFSTRSHQEDLAPNLNRILQGLLTSHQLDVLLIDTDAGILDFNFLIDAISDCLLWVMRLDQLHYQGTATMVDLARGVLGIPSVVLIASEVLNRYDFAQVKSQLEEVYQTPAYVLPLIQDWVGFEGILSLEHPDHPWSEGMRAIAAGLT